MVHVTRSITMHFHAVWCRRDEGARLHGVVLRRREVLLLLMGVVVRALEGEVEKVVGVLHVAWRLQRLLLLCTGTIILVLWRDGAGGWQMLGVERVGEGRELVIGGLGLAGVVERDVEVNVAEVE